MLAKFNETMEPLYMLLKEIEDIRLTTDLLDPDIDSRIEQSNNVFDDNFSTGKWADKKKGMNQMYSNLLRNDIQNFNVKIEDSSTAPLVSNQPKKEQPIWMLESTISGANTFDTSKGKLVNGNGPNAIIRPILDTLELPSNGEFSSEQAKEILEMLLSYEKPNELKWIKIAKCFGYKNEFIKIDGETEMEEDKENNVANHVIDNGDFFNTLPMIRVNNCMMRLTQINDDHILMMSDQEKQDYIRVAQQIYSTIFDI